MAINWSFLKSWLPALEAAGNVALMLIPGGAAFAPLAAALENSVNPLLTSISSGSTATQEVMAVYGTIIGILTALEQNTKLDAATLEKVKEYLASAQAALTAYVTAGSGYNPDLYTPVTPIA